MCTKRTGTFHINPFIASVSMITPFLLQLLQLRKWHTGTKTQVHMLQYIET